MERWNRAQRVVIVVAWGVLLLYVWEWIQMSPWSNGGWYNYAPNSGVMFNGSALQTNPGLRMFGQLVVVLVWLVPRLWLLSDRSSTSQDASAASPGDPDPLQR